MDALGEGRAAAGTPPPVSSPAGETGIPTHPWEAAEGQLNRHRCCAYPSYNPNTSKPPRGTAADSIPHLWLCRPAAQGHFQKPGPHQIPVSRSPCRALGRRHSPCHQSLHCHAAVGNPSSQKNPQTHSVLSYSSPAQIKHSCSNLYDPWCQMPLIIPSGQLLLLLHLLNISRTQKSSGRKAVILTNCSSSSTSYCVSFLPLKHQELIKTYGLPQHYQEFQFRKWNIDILNITFHFPLGALPHTDTDPCWNTASSHRLQCKSQPDGLFYMDFGTSCWWSQPITIS